MKVCLVGETLVGKTSLIRRFVLDTFDDPYVATLGTKVCRKEVAVSLPGKSTSVVNMLVWDVMGIRGFREVLKDAYFSGAVGILAVADITRRATLEDLRDWTESAVRITGPVPILFAANKADLERDAEVGREETEEFAAEFGADSIMTSAKTGMNVEAAFRRLAGNIATARLLTSQTQDTDCQDAG